MFDDYVIYFKYITQNFLLSLNRLPSKVNLCRTNRTAALILIETDSKFTCHAVVKS